MRRLILQVLRWAGSLLAVGGVLFVGLRLYDYRNQIDTAIIDLQLLVTILGAAIIYGLSNLFCALAWRNIVKQLGQDMPFQLSIRIYGISQIAKYIPGNIFQFAGRQAMGMASGFSGRVLIKSAAYELGLLACAAGLFCALIFPSELLAKIGLSDVTLFCTGLGLALIILRLLVNTNVSGIFLSYVVFLSISGSIFYWILSNVGSTVNIAGSVVVGAFVVSWLVGFVTPGAPAGVGVRELLLVFFLQDAVTQEGLLITAVILSRVVTAFGDVLFFSYAYSLDYLSKRERLAH